MQAAAWCWHTSEDCSRVSMPSWPIKGTSQRRKGEITAKSLADMPMLAQAPGCWLELATGVDPGTGNQALQAQAQHAEGDLP